MDNRDQYNDARDMTTTPVPDDLKGDQVSSGEELIPAEVAARKEREGKPSEMPGDSKPDGYTVSGQGLTNNYAVTPPVYKEQKSDTEKRRDYTMVGIVGLVIVALLVGITFLVNL